MNRLLLAIVLVVGAAMLVEVPWRGIDPDELEHVHAACAVAWGQLPYRDFFEHHTPALYYLLQPILCAAGTEPPALWWCRLLMWTVGMATLAVTGATAYRLSGKAAALVAPALLGSTTIFFQKAVEVRPDAPAMLLLATAAYWSVAARRRRTRWAMILTGLLLGAATLCTQKAIVPAAALIFAQLAVSCCRGRSRRAIRARRGHAVAYVVFTTAAIVATWLAATGLFFLAGGAGAFLDATLMQLWRWPVRLSPWESLRPTLSADLTFWIVAAAAVVAGMSRLARISRRMEKPDNRDGRQECLPHRDEKRGPEKGKSSHGRAVLSLAVLVCLAGGLMLQAAYAQYYLLWFPLAAVVGADWLVRLATGTRSHASRGNAPSGTLRALAEEPSSATAGGVADGRGASEQCVTMRSIVTRGLTPQTKRRFLAAAVALLSIEMLLVGRAIFHGEDGPLPHLLDVLHGIPVVVAGAAAAVILAALATIACVGAVRNRRATAVLGLALLGFGYAGARNLDALCWSNRRQVAAMAEVCRLVGPNETVFDGFTGLGAFRRHAYYYWWLNPYSLRLMSPAARQGELLAVLKRSPPKVVCLDENVRSLPPSVLAWIRGHYEPFDPPIYRRAGSK